MSSNFSKTWVRHPRLHLANKIDINKFKRTITYHSNPYSSNRQHQRGKTGTLRLFWKFRWNFHDPRHFALLCRSKFLELYHQGRLSLREWGCHAPNDQGYEMSDLCDPSQRMSQCPKLAAYFGNVILSVTVWLVYRGYLTHLTTVNWEGGSCIKRRTGHFDNFSR